MLGTNVGVDIGTTHVLVYVEGKGVVVEEPCVAAYSAITGERIAVGTRALKMVGRNPASIRVVKPMHGGLISDFMATNHILRQFLSHVSKNMVFKPNVVACVPAGLTKLEKRTILDVITTAGAAKACLIDEPLAAALGSGLDVHRPSGTMVVNIGGGTTDVAVVTMGSMSVSRSIRVAGNALNESIVRYFKRTQRVHFGERTAEMLKMEIGCARPREADVAISANGKDMISGIPVRVEVSSAQLYSAMRDTLDTISDAVTDILRVTPPELAGDIQHNGIVLSGGGALLHGMAEMLEADTGVPTRVAPEPMRCVALGVGAALKNPQLLKTNGYEFKTREDITGYRE